MNKIHLVCYMKQNKQNYAKQSKVPFHFSYFITATYKCMLNVHIQYVDLFYIYFSLFYWQH